MALIDREFDAFLRLVVRAVEPYLPDMVIVGGCANALYRHHPLATESLIARPGTRDLDVACPTRLIGHGRRPLMDLLRAAGLEIHHYGHAQPPIIKFTSKNTPDGVDLEFLCPRKGSGQDRRGDETIAVEIEGSGLTAQALRYLDLLLIAPWEISLRRVPGFEAVSALPPVRIANPLAYLVQKVLARDEQGRPTAKQEKDCYYIYEVSVVFRDVLDRVAGAMPEIEAKCPAAWKRRFVKTIQRLFASPQAEGPVSAVRVGRAAREGDPRAPEVNEVMIHAAVSRLVEAVR